MRNSSHVGPLSSVNFTGFPGFDAPNLNDPAIKSGLARYSPKAVSAAGVGTTGAFGGVVSGQTNAPPHEPKPRRARQMPSMQNQVLAAFHGSTCSPLEAALG